MSETLTNTQLKQRILGAGILVLLAAILIPLFLGDPKNATDGEGEQAEGTVFESKIQPLPAAGEDGSMPGGAENTSEGNGGLVLKKLENDAPRKVRKGTAQSKDVVIKPLDMKEATSSTNSTQDSQVESKIQPAPAPKSEPKPVEPKKVAQPAPVKKAAPVAPKPSKTAKSTATTGWVVQAGVFGKAKNATDLAAVLKSNGYSPRVSDVTGKPGIKKRVWIGPFASKSEAQAVSKKLQRQTGNAGYIAPYPFNS